MKHVYIAGIAPGQASDYKAIEKTELDKLRCLNGGRCMGPIGLDFRQENISIETKDQQIYAFEEQVPYGPHRDKTCLRGHTNNKAPDQPEHP